MSSLFQALELVNDPRARRGVRHQFQPILRLVIWGFASKLVAIEHIVAFARGQWKSLGKALGFSRPNPPDPTTIRRVLSQVKVAEIQQAFTEWVGTLTKGELASASVDGKVLRNVRHESGELLEVLNVFAHEIKLTLLQQPIEEDKGESTTLSQTLKQLFEMYPGLSILTGDSAFTGRSLCQAIIDAGKQYIVQIKGNQRWLKSELEKSLDPVVKRRSPDVTEKKKGCQQRRRLQRDQTILGGKRG